MKNLKVHVIGIMKIKHDIEYAEILNRIWILYQFSIYSCQECGIIFKNKIMKIHMQSEHMTYKNLIFGLEYMEYSVCIE